MKRVLTYLSLFSSLSTLICCALPALLVSVGLGAALASGISAVPQLIWFSENKGLVFAIAGILLLSNLLLQIYARDLSCPTDPVLRDACIRGRAFSKWMLAASIAIYLIGAFFAFLAAEIFA